MSLGFLLNGSGESGESLITPDSLSFSFSRSAAPFSLKKQKQDKANPFSQKIRTHMYFYDVLVSHILDLIIYKVL